MSGLASGAGGAVAAEVPGTTGSVRRQLRLFRYARPHWRGFVLMGASMIFEVLMTLARPWPIAILIDYVIRNHRAPHWLTVLPGAGSRHGLLILAAVAEVLIFLAGTLANAVSTYSALKLGQQMTWSLAGDLFRHLQRLSLLFHTRRAVGDLIERVTTDSYSIDTLITGAILPGLQALVMLVSAFAIMWALEWRLTLIAVAVVPLIVVTVRYMSRPLKERSRERRDSEGRMSAVVEQTLNAMPAVQAFTREAHQERHFRAHAEQTVRAYVRATFTGMWFQLFAGLAISLGTAAVIYVGGTLALKGTLTAGVVVVFVSYLTSLYEPIDSLSHTAQTVQNAAAETDRVMEILEIEPSVSDRPGAIERTMTGPVCYEHVSFGYEPDREILHDISLTVAPERCWPWSGPRGPARRPSSA